MMKFSKIVLLVSFVLAFGLILYVRPFFMGQGSFLEVPSSSMHKKPSKLQVNNIKPFLFGFEPLMADVVWIYTMAEMDLMLPSEKEYQRYYTLAHLATDLDPRFEPLYLFMANQLMFGRQGTDTHERVTKDAKDLLQKGWDFYLNREEDWQHYPQYWMIPQMIGFYYYLEQKDPERALPYYEYIAHHVPHAPALYKTMVSSMYEKLNREDQSMKFLENALLRESLQGQLKMYRDNQDVIEKIEKKLKVLNQDGISQAAIAEMVQKMRDKSQAVFETWMDAYPYLTFELFLQLHPEIFLPKSLAELDMNDLIFQDRE